MLVSNHTPPSYLAVASLYGPLWVSESSRTQSQKRYKKPYEIVSVIDGKSGTDSGKKFYEIYKSMYRGTYAEAAASFEKLTLDGSDDSLTRQDDGAWPNAFGKVRLL